MKSIDVALPEDLCDWMSNTQLLAAVLSGVTDTRLPLDTGKDTVLERTGGFRTWVTLTAYCYCRGYDSTEKIERAFENDSMVRYLLFNRRPPLDDIRLIRKAYRTVLLEVMSRTLNRAFQYRASFEPIWSSKNPVTKDLQSALEACCRTEATNRIDLAALHDTAALDF